MKGSAWLFSACKEVMERPDCWAGAKAEAELARRATVRVASFIMVKECIADEDLQIAGQRFFDAIALPLRVRTSTCGYVTSYVSQDRGWPVQPAVCSLLPPLLAF
jgi:hypothetical protein